MPQGQGRPGRRTRPSRPRTGSRTRPPRPKTGPRTGILPSRTTKDQEPKLTTKSLLLRQSYRSVQRAVLRDILLRPLACRGVTDRGGDSDEERGKQHRQTDGVGLVAITYRVVVAEETSPGRPHRDV